jgi:hypothetical protein
MKDIRRTGFGCRLRTVRQVEIKQNQLQSAENNYRESLKIAMTAAAA